MSWNASLIDGPIEDPNDPTGYRLNVAPSVVCDEIEPYRVSPNEKLRRFAGAQTHRFLFPDEQTARALLGGFWIEGEGA